MLDQNINKMLGLNVNQHTEKKNGLTYLSWAWAWDQALRADPKAEFRVRTFSGPNNETMPYMDVNGTAIVWVDVILFGKMQECFLPVMDHRNRPIQTPDAFQINTALMRCLTKCLSLFGLGLYIYAGEDLPSDGSAEIEEATQKPAKVEDKAEPADAFDDAPRVPNTTLEDLTLFADGMLEYVALNKTEKGLISFWKKNQTTIDKLKEKKPDLYAIVLTKFQEAKAAIKAQQQE